LGNRDGGKIAKYGHVRDAGVTWRAKLSSVSPDRDHFTVSARGPKRAPESEAERDSSYDRYCYFITVIQIRSHFVVRTMRLIRDRRIITATKAGWFC